MPPLLTPPPLLPTSLLALCWEELHHVVELRTVTTSKTAGCQGPQAYRIVVGRVHHLRVGGVVPLVPTVVRRRTQCPHLGVGALPQRNRAEVARGRPLSAQVFLSSSLTVLARK